MAETREFVGCEWSEPRPAGQTRRSAKMILLALEDAEGWSVSGFEDFVQVDNPFASDTPLIVEGADGSQEGR